MSSIGSIGRNVSYDDYNAKKEEVREDSVLQTLLQQFEKANSEQRSNCDRLLSIHSKLNLEPPSPEKPQVPIARLWLTSGEGLLATLESFVTRYKEAIDVQNAVISKLERLI